MDRLVHHQGTPGKERPVTAVALEHGFAMLARLVFLQSYARVQC